MMRGNVKGAVCGWSLEEAAWRLGALRIAGLDEVGRGPLFGPVVAAAVILPKGCRLQDLTDSKKLSEKRRNELDVEIRACAVAWAIAAVDAETIDRINIRRASLEAMRRAVEQIALRVDLQRDPDCLLPDFLLIDGRDTIECWPRCFATGC
jgi:ribonuclease HII